MSIFDIFAKLEQERKQQDSSAGPTLSSILLYNIANFIFTIFINLDMFSISRIFISMCT